MDTKQDPRTIDTEGGTYIEGNVDAEGGFVGRDKITGDQVRGNKIGQVFQTITQQAKALWAIVVLAIVAIVVFAVLWFFGRAPTVVIVPPPPDVTAQETLGDRETGLPVVGRFVLLEVPPLDDCEQALRASVQFVSLHTRWQVLRRIRNSSPGSVHALRAYIQRVADYVAQVSTDAETELVIVTTPWLDCDEWEDVLADLERLDDVEIRVIVVAEENARAKGDDVFPTLEAIESIDAVPLWVTPTPETVPAFTPTVGRAGPPVVLDHPATSTPKPAPTSPPPTKTATPTRTATATETSTPTPTPTVCVPELHYVADVTVPDGQEMLPGEGFTKVWKLRVADCGGDFQARLVHMSGDRLGATSPLAVSVPATDTVDLPLPMVAPLEEGEFRSEWELRVPVEKGSSERLWVIIVVAPPTPTPTPLPPPAPDQPSQPSQPKPTATATPPPPGPCLCDSDRYNCSSFGSPGEAQRCFDYCKSLGKGDVHGLDHDGDGVVCE